MTEVKGQTWDFAGNRLSRKNALALCYSKGWRRATKLITAVAVMEAESQRYAGAYHHNHEHTPDGAHVIDNETGQPFVLSTDRGLFQVNDKAHPRPFPEELFDPEVNAEVAYDIYRSRDKDFTAWAAYNSGAYLRYVPLVTASWALGRWRERVPYWEG